MKLKTFLLLLIILILTTSCSSAIRFSSSTFKEKSQKDNLNKSESIRNNKSDIIGNNDNNNNVDNEVMHGYASYYGEQFDGKMTSSGEIYNMDDLTAAHQTLEFGTKVLVTNLKNHRKVVVRINDRGPFVEGRIIDLSKAAAEVLDMIQDGVVEVELKILE
jgi:rare lipoprotein A (peptidoglycan hydrolase)